MKFILISRYRRGVDVTNIEAPGLGAAIQEATGHCVYLGGAGDANDSFISAELIQVASAVSMDSHIKQELDALRAAEVMVKVEPNREYVNRKAQQ